MLEIAGMCSKEQHKYIGRTQYPKIVNKPVAAPALKGNTFSCKDLMAVSEVSNRLHAYTEINVDQTHHVAHICKYFLQARDAVLVALGDCIDETVTNSEREHFLHHSPSIEVHRLYDLFHRSVSALSVL